MKFTAERCDFHPIQVVQARYKTLLTRTGYVTAQFKSQIDKKKIEKYLSFD
jgi:hypothetical protein